MKLLHTADFHARDKDIEECEKVLSFLVNTAHEEAVDLAVIAGDIFDSQDTKLDSKAAKLVVKTVSALADICPIAIITGTPSHDSTAPQILAYVRGDHTVWVATTPQQVILWNGLLSLMPPPDHSKIKAVLSLIPQPTKQYFQSQSDIRKSDQEIGQAMSELFAGFGVQAAEYKEIPHLLVYHGGISGASLPNGYVPIGMDIEVSTDQMMLANPEIGLMGHIHIAQKLGDRFFYSGPLYATKIDETGPNGFWIHERSMDLGTFLHPEWSSRFIETPCKKIIRLQEDFTDPKMLEIDLSDLDAICDEDGNPLADSVSGAYLRMEFKVWQDEAGKLDRDKLRDFYLSAGALDVDVRIVRVPRQTVRSETVLKAERLRDKLVAMNSMEEGRPDLAESILEKADALENKQPDDLLEDIGNGRRT